MLSVCGQTRAANPGGGLPFDLHTGLSDPEVN